MDIIQKIYAPNGDAIVDDYTFTFRTDCNTSEPYIHVISDTEKILCYHDMYIDGQIQYSRSYRYIRFTDNKKTMNQIRSTVTIEVEDLKNLLMTSRPFERTQPFSDENIVVEKIGDVDDNLLNKYFDMHKNGELPEDWEGLLYLTNTSKATYAGYLYKIRNTSLDYTFDD
jgi:hypothetical protein